MFNTFSEQVELDMAYQWVSANVESVTVDLQRHLECIEVVFVQLENNTRWLEERLNNFGLTLPNWFDFIQVITFEFKTQCQKF